MNFCWSPTKMSLSYLEGIRMGAAEDYFARTMELLQDLRETQMDNIDQAAEICSESIAKPNHKTTHQKGAGQPRRRTNPGGDLAENGSHLPIHSARAS